MKKIVGFLLLMIISLSFINVNAKTSLFELSDSINLNEEVEGTQFSLGENIKQTSNINGISFKLGNLIEEENAKSEYTFAMGNIINIKSSETKDAFYLANEVTIDESSIIDRDLYIAANTININGVVKRNIKATANTININGTIYGELKISAKELNVKENASITKLTYNDKVIKNISESSTITTKEQYHINERANNTNRFNNALTSLLTEAVAIIILMTFLNKPLSSLRREKLDSKELLSSFGKGFISLLILPLLIIFLIIAYLTSKISIILLLMYVLAIVLSSLVFNYYLAFPLLRNIKNDTVKVLIISLIVELLTYLPYVGFIVGFIRLTIGIGLIYTLIKKNTINNNKEA